MAIYHLKFFSTQQQISSGRMFIIILYVCNKIMVEPVPSSMICASLRVRIGKINFKIIIKIWSAWLCESMTISTLPASKRDQGKATNCKSTGLENVHCNYNKSTPGNRDFHNHSLWETCQILLKNMKLSIKYWVNSLVFIKQPKPAIMPAPIPYKSDSRAQGVRSINFLKFQLYWKQEQHRIIN